MHKTQDGRHEGKHSFERSKCGWEDNIKMALKKLKV
jgi:hypothetical protein